MKTKEQLIKENAILNEQVDLLHDEDERIRRYISEFLGSVENSMYSSRTEVKVLKWAHIYFELGKLKRENNGFREIQSIKSQLDQFNTDIRELRNEVFSTKEEKES
jgi:prefoldin subunit 5